MVEFVILLPLYLLLLLGAFYLGRIAFFQERSLEATRLAAMMPGNQSEFPRRRGIVAQAFFEPGVGQLTLTEFSQELPTWGDVERILYPPPLPPAPPRPARATGHADIDLDSLQDDIETVIQGQPASPPPPPPPPTPQYRDIRLINVLHNLMRAWARRTSSHSSYRYRPAYLALEPVRLRPAKPSAAHQVVSRTGSAREVRGLRGESLSPSLLNQFGDGRAPVSGFPYFGGFPSRFMSPN